MCVYVYTHTYAQAQNTYMIHICMCVQISQHFQIYTPIHRRKGIRYGLRYLVLTGSSIVVCIRRPHLRQQTHLNRWAPDKKGQRKASDGRDVGKRVIIKKRKYREERRQERDGTRREG